MSDTFVVHLGGGAYLDASGQITFGAPTAAQVYQTPQGFKVDTKKLEDVFKSLSGMLPSSDEDKKQWIGYGVPKQLVEFLAKISGTVKIMGTAIAVYVWAIGVLLTIMDLMMADDGMSPQLAQALFNIKNQLQGLEQIQRAEKMIQMRADFNGRADRIRTQLTRLVVEKPVGAARAQIFTQMLAILDELAVPLSNLVSQEWAVTYDPDSYKGRGFASELLVTQNTDGSLAPVPMRPPTVTMFDYRLGVPMLLYGATTYTALAQIAMPWFRSAGMYAGSLRETADAIDSFVLRMQNECLARTYYTPQTVLQQETWSIFEVPFGGGQRDWSFASTLAAGAFDLVSYNDSFLVNQFSNHIAANTDTGPRGLFNYHWHGPAPLLSQSTLEELAAGANKQAEQDYATLQTVTGMFQLILSAAWLRYLSTPPTSSQTVTGSASDTRVPRDTTPVTATSPPIFPVTVIEHAATLKRYNASNRVGMITQEPGYVPAFRYRVLLRAINTVFSKEGWRRLDYIGDVWSADYENTAGDPRCKRLRTNVRSDLILSEILLYEGPSPTEPLTISKKHVSMQAATFDWYVPVVTPWSRHSEVARQAGRAVASSKSQKGAMTNDGGVSIHLLGQDALLGPQPMEIMSSPVPLASATTADAVLGSALSALNDVSLDKAERRHVKTENVEFDWELTWASGTLVVNIYGKPENRPFQLHLVVEETVYSGETLPTAAADILSDNSLVEQIHTPVVAEIVNQLVLVPEEFFDEERKAIDAANKLLGEFERRFAKSARVSPGTPVEDLQNSIRQMLNQSASTATIASAIDERVRFAMREAPELWNQVRAEVQ
jgi:hypothetical protein